MADLTDAQLVEAIVAGDDVTLAAFVARLRPRFESFARRRGIASCDCPDIAQDAIADAVHQLRQGRFRGEAKLSTFLYTIVNARIVDHIRRRAAGVVSFEQDLDRNDPVFLATVRYDETVFVQQALASLPAQDQMLLWLHDVERYTLAELGPLFGVRRSALSERLNMARERFRTAILAGGSIPDVPRLID